MRELVVFLYLLLNENCLAQTQTQTQTQTQAQAQAQAQDCPARLISSGSRVYLRLLDRAFANKWIDGARLTEVSRSVQPVNPLAQSRGTAQLAMKRGFANQIARFLEGEWTHLNPYLLERVAALNLIEQTQAKALVETRNVWLGRPIEAPELMSAEFQTPYMTSRGELFLPVRDGTRLKSYELYARRFVDLNLTTAGEWASDLFEGSTGTVYIAVTTIEGLYVFDARSGQKLHDLSAASLGRVKEAQVVGQPHLYEQDGQVHVSWAPPGPFQRSNYPGDLPTVDVPLGSSDLRIDFVPDRPWRRTRADDGHLYVYGTRPDKYRFMIFYLRDLSTQTTIIEHNQMRSGQVAHVQLAWTEDGRITLIKKDGRTFEIFDLGSRRFVPIQTFANQPLRSIAYGKEESGQRVFSAVVTVADEELGNLDFLVHSTDIARRISLPRGSFDDSSSISALELLKTEQGLIRLVWRQGGRENELRLNIYGLRNADLVAEMRFSPALSAHLGTFLNPVTGEILALFQSVGGPKLVRIFGEVKDKVFTVKLDPLVKPTP